MAISKSIIGSMSAMAEFLDDSGFFDDVVFDETGGTGYEKISCKDADNNIVFEIENMGSNAAKWSGFAGYSASVYEQVGGVTCTAWSTAKGLMFTNGYSSSDHNGAACIVSKTNNDAYCVLLPKDNKAEWASTVYKAIDQKAIAWGDVSPLTNLVNSGVVVTGQSNYVPITETANQTIFLPIATHSDYGAPSYFADAFFLPISQFRSETVFEIDDVKYVTDGFVCLRDE